MGEKVDDKVNKSDLEAVDDNLKPSKIKYWVSNLLFSIGLFFVKLSVKIRKSQFQKKMEKAVAALEVAFDDIDNEFDDFIKKRINDCAIEKKENDCRCKMMNKKCGGE